ncbi:MULTISPECIES: anthranilate synthase component I [unclassified Oceanobacter]|jgi:anthranilate synthase component 1|uniref:anthranilate synthase component I n=1 Tax=unclassified Oceanobacter TaxID=2620260 RepID=UPI0026E2202E|nr:MULTISPECIES: anthranilate synthase component I [unclassified Oceanobacter]MDO6681639.1 anthranilate synthase component I [Oceanobacter sp. 5_MG-2023]MDP2505733.1 anthranilate synthase component I [Oceanobacter sp. 3_MG-2023]MDP2547440.1 anthranilate synthase component I [Oceanobacter sp. 4_MG-2023]MDP2608228.1 anthranilate synthase component I [Oceanobacter sp. 1_MG-2023]MDP2612954.1 anthranilate synthase component I [Oceanobacter sp. 2_MG-2023]
MTPQEFETLVAQGYNRIPVSRQVLADIDTPLSTYLKLADRPYSYLFESVQGGEKWGRYSMIGLPARHVIKVTGHRIIRQENGDTVSELEVRDPLQYISELQQSYKVPDLPGLPRFQGGLVGYFGYDTVRYIEPRLEKGCPADELNTPDILLMVSEEVVVFDNLSGTLHLIVLADPQQPNALAVAEQRIEQLREQLRQPYQGEIGQPLAQPREVEEKDFRSMFGADEFRAAVASIKDYIFAGDIMQCVISQRMQIPFAGDPVNIYRALRTLNPSPYMYCMHLGDFHVVGSSPEILARLEDGEVTVRPIAGTRKRGHNAAEDLALEQELLADPKEIAEHLMLIDLGRNDVGRVAQTGKVELTDRMVVEHYSHVMHIVSNVTGQVKEGTTAMDVLRAVHPAGTLSGAPKIRAMEIIDEMESTKRGVYGGAVGYLSWNGNMDTAIAIRTAVIKDGMLNIQAGAGIVADSVPEMEWQETLNKGRAMFRAVALAEAGLDQ